MANIKPSFLPPFQGMDVATFLESRAKSRGAHPFLIWDPFEGPGRRWTYAEFNDAVARLAGGLAGRGIAKGDRVMVHLENCPENLLTWFACARLGAVCVPTNAMAAGPELAWFAELTGASCAITQPKFVELVAAHCPKLKWIAVTGSDSFESLYAEALPLRKADPLAPVSIMFTSGTTSRSKGVLWTHANALWGAQLGALQQRLRDDDVYHIFLPLFHTVAMSWCLLPAMWAGATVVLQPRFSASRYWPSVVEHRCTVGAQVQFTSAILAKQPVPAHHFRLWALSIYLPEYEKHFGVRIVTSWGMTEVIAQGIISDPLMPDRPRTIGRPSLGYQVRVVDDAGNPVGPGATGNLLIKGVRGLSLFAEYFADPEATAQAFDADGYFRTGDRVVVHEDGSLQFADRAKDVIKVGGENVSAAEVERVVAAVAGVKECAVVAKADETYGEVAVVFVTLAAGAPPDVPGRVVEHCRASLAKFKVPREVIVLDEMPRANIGKLAKAELRKRLDSGTQS